MNSIVKSLAIASAFVFTNAASAENNLFNLLKPLQGHIINMENFTAAVYYTVLSNGKYEVITTIGPNENVVGATTQHVVTMDIGQSYSFSFDQGSTQYAKTTINFKSTVNELRVASK